MYIWLVSYFFEDNKCIMVIKNHVAYYFKWIFAKLSYLCSLSEAVQININNFSE